MKNKILLIITLLFYSFTIGQNYQSIEDVENTCTELGFSSNEKAEDAVDKILEQVGLFKNFIIVECPNINNAEAKNIYEKGLLARYILYDSEFFKRIENTSSNDWAAISILAHEIGHHLNGHTMYDEGSNHEWELEADEFSGFVLGKMGATLTDAQSAIKTLRFEKATSTHPAKADRLLKIREGWEKATKGISEIVENENTATAEENYLKGLKEFQKENYEVAHSFFFKAAEEGHVDAQWYVGEAYQGGVVVIQDYKESRLWYRRAAENGNEKAQYALGWVYQNGIGGVNIDGKEAFLWFFKAAEQGHLEAQTSVGLMFYDGWDIKKNYQEAFKWLNKATDQGNSARGRAEYNLGLMYEKGKGVFKDKNKAISWYKKAAQLHNYFAQKKLTKLGKSW